MAKLPNFGGDFTKDKKEYEKITGSLGFSVNNIIYAKQTHGDNIIVCGGNIADAPRSGDAMITDIPGILLSVRTADCVPILFWDEENCDHKIIGAAHCGWRGTIDKLQIKTILKMQEIYGINPKKLKAAIGPCISKCCYEVSDDFYGNFVNILGERVKIYFTEKDIKNNNKYMCDLKGINKMLLSELLDENNIEISPDCTCCEPDKYFSHRRQGENRGTHASFIGIL
ncbi:MAG: peptidoglycan editing factor PgeF [Oscillospiraceae bacterium]|nr:peptidoglycan editing factor PgeF [Oscillospiraceae bacterium]